MAPIQWIGPYTHCKLSQMRMIPFSPPHVVSQFLLQVQQEDCQKARVKKKK